MSIAPLKTYLNEILFEIQKFSFHKMYLKMLSAKCQAFCLGLNVWTNWQQEMHYTNAYIFHLGLALFFCSYKINSKICDTYLCHNGNENCVYNTRMSQSFHLDIIQECVCCCLTGRSGFTNDPDLQDHRADYSNQTEILPLVRRIISFVKLGLGVIGHKDLCVKCNGYTNVACGLTQPQPPSHSLLCFD